MLNVRRFAIPIFVFSTVLAAGCSQSTPLKVSPTDSLGPCQIKLPGQAIFQEGIGWTSTGQYTACVSGRYLSLTNISPSSYHEVFKLQDARGTNYVFMPVANARFTVNNDDYVPTANDIARATSNVVYSHATAFYNDYVVQYYPQVALTKDSATVAPGQTVYVESPIGTLLQSDRLLFGRDEVATATETMLLDYVDQGLQVASPGASDAADCVNDMRAEALMLKGDPLSTIWNQYLNDQQNNLTIQHNNLTTQQEVKLMGKIANECAAANKELGENQDRPPLTIKEFISKTSAKVFEVELPKLGTIVTDDLKEEEFK
jgi:hypothetical protein